METFVVRIARPDPSASGAKPRELHGVVEQLRSKQSHAFRGSHELLALLSDELQPDFGPSPAPTEGDDERPSTGLEARP